MKSGLTDITIILDRSGSMAAMWDQTIEGVNKFISEQQKEPGEATVTLIQFDDQYQLDFQGKPIKDVLFLNPETYVPRGMTALHDAIGKTINDVGQRLAGLPEEERPEKVMIIIQTDGLENSSREFNGPKIKEMIEHQQAKYNWAFQFIAAGQDAIITGASIGISSQHTLSYTIGDPQSVAHSFACVTRNLSTFRAKGEYEFSEEDRKQQKTWGAQ